MTPLQTPLQTPPKSPPLTVAMVHHHLRQGGVTRVIHNAIRALQNEPIHLLVVSGEPPTHPTDWPVPVIVVPEIGYAESPPHPDARTIRTAVERAVRAANHGRLPDLWHIHNHALGKNPAWTEVVANWASENSRLLLQIHDFAEDGRPTNYQTLCQHLAPTTRGTTLYPAAATTQFALLTPRDVAILRSAGVASDRLHLLPNAVDTASRETPPPPTDQPPLILYPTRAIRRKNIGEFLLWSAVRSGDQRFGITLAAQSPAERPAYERWRHVAAEHNLPVSFEMGRTASFESLLQRAAVLFTTSIAEGFGLAFLEPWLADRPLAGRDLPEITAAFKADGIHLDSLYDECWIPAAWIDRPGFLARLQTTFAAYQQTYGRPCTDAMQQQVAQAACRDDTVAFGHLDAIAQEEAIAHARQDPHAATWLTAWTADPTTIATNHDAITRHYGLDTYRDRLTTLYHHLLQTQPAAAQPVDADAVLDQFLAPARFRMLRT
jgi:glycosyltransferase involved in cell wall biosynthesis